MDKQIKAEIKSLMKQGFPEDIAIITACANGGKPEAAIDYLEEFVEDQNDILLGLELMGMRPFHESLTVVVRADEPKETITVTHHELEPINEIIYATMDISGTNGVTEKN